jgi:hypothetical protein
VREQGDAWERLGIVTTLCAQVAAADANSVVNFNEEYLFPGFHVSRFSRNGERPALKVFEDETTADTSVLWMVNGGPVRNQI